MFGPVSNVPGDILVQSPVVKVSVLKFEKLMSFRVEPFTVWCVSMLDVS